MRMIAIGEVVVVSSYDTIHEVLRANGTAFSDRPNFFRLKYTIGEMVGFKNNDASWRKLRKLSHSYLKQFGGGMTRLEDTLREVAERMIGALAALNSSPINTMEILRKASFQSISVLLLGRVVDAHNPILKMIMEYEKSVIRCFSSLRLDMAILDAFPWLIRYPLSSSKELKAFIKLQSRVWGAIKQDQKQSAHDSLTKLLLTNVGDNTTGSADVSTFGLTDEEAGQTCLNLIAAGLSTTSMAMHCIINSLAYRRDVQDEIYTEIQKVLSDIDSRSVSLAQKLMMPYLRATVLETLRHFSITPLGGAPHVAREDTELKGYGAVPKGTTFIINAWSLHHDKAFWGDPENFRPERFLDEHGKLLAADHPKRKHLLPFSAGPRSCMGEVFAMALLFLWTSALVNKFVIKTAEGCDPEWMDPDLHQDDSALLRPLPCDVIFLQRGKDSL